MKKRREILAALKEDSRISSLEGELQRKTSEADAYRRFVERDSKAEEGSKNQIEQLQQLLLEDQWKTGELLSDLNLVKLEAERNLSFERQQHQEEVDRLSEELSKAQSILLSKQDSIIETARGRPGNDESTRERNEGKEEDVGPATRASIQQQRGLESKLRLAELELKKLQRQSERETRRAERAEALVEEFREQMDALKAEQGVKDSQLVALRADLQDIVTSSNYLPLHSSSTPRAAPFGLREGKESSDFVLESKISLERSEVEDAHESFEDVMAEELAAMKHSYEERIECLQEQLDATKREVKELNEEIKSLRH